MLTLEVYKRLPKENLNKTRTQGRLPAVFYGRKEESTPISVPFVAFMKIWKEAGETSVIKLGGEAGGEREVFIKEVDLDPIKNTPRHVDFYVYEKGKKMEVDIPLEFIGVSPAVKDLGGILIKVMHVLKVEAQPKDLPRKLEVDIATLVAFDSQILVSNIKLPEGVSVKNDPTEVVAAITEPKEEEETPSAPLDLSQIEVEKKGKEAKEGELAEEGEPADNK
jgi:large subunit ribosomal protein L25